jgi:hypothetical protein
MAIFVPKANLRLGTPGYRWYQLQSFLAVKKTDL